MRYFKVFNQKVAGILMIRGFVLQGVEPNRREKGFNVFLFKDSDDLREAVHEITK